MSASHNSPVLLRFCTGLRIGERLIVDQEVVGSNPAPSIDCLATPLQRSQTVLSSGPTSQAFLSTDVDSIDNKNFVVGQKDTLFRVLLFLLVERPAAVKLVTGVAEQGVGYTPEDRLGRFPFRCGIKISPAVSNHSNQPPAALRGTAVRAARGTVKEAL